MFKLATFRNEAAVWPLAQPDASAKTRPWLSALLAVPRRLGAAILTEIRARRAMQTLANLDARMLRDIGVEHDQIPYACRQGRDALLRPSDLNADVARWV